MLNPTPNAAFLANRKRKFNHTLPPKQSGSSSCRGLFRMIPVILVTWVCILGVPATTNAQEYPEIEKYIAEKKFPQANALLQAELKTFFTQKNYDTLLTFIPLLGKIVAGQQNATAAVKAVKQLVENIKSQTTDKNTLRDLYLEASEYYAAQSQYQSAYDTKMLALSIASSIPGTKPEVIGVIHNDLATYASRMDNYDQSGFHARKAISIFLGAKEPDYERVYISCNGLAATFWYASKNDSALRYYDLAFKALNKAKPTPLNRYYRTAIVQNNISGLYSAQGNVTKAIEAMKITINNLRLFLATPESASRKDDAVSFQFQAIDNLAGIYKELGNFSKAMDLLTYSYEQKQKQLDAANPDIFKSQILLGQIYYSILDYDRAKDFLQKGHDNISTADGDYIIWRADASRYLALIAEHHGDTLLAGSQFRKADSLYEISLQGSYDNIYLEFLNEHSLFHAKLRHSKTALSLAGKGYNYISKTQGPETLGSFQQLLNLAQVNFSSGIYKEALARSKKSLEVLDKVISKAESPLDSIRMELQKTGAILLKVKSEYELLPERNTQTLVPILEQLREAMRLLDKRKSIFTDPDDIRLLVASNSLLIDFMKKITMEIYFLTKNKTYLDELLGFHESGLYTRIRSRLDKTDTSRFLGVPANIRSEEIQLKKGITIALQDAGSNSDNMKRYLNADAAWNSFLEKLRKNYPAYYSMRYASVIYPLERVLNNLPDQTSVVRYFFIEDKLFALVADKQRKEIIALQPQNLDQQLKTLTRFAMDEPRVTATLYSLYSQLWQPLAGMIRTSRIIIIPDGMLYGLSFELLTSQPIKSFDQLAEKSLLASSTISYHYSLLAIENKSKKKNYSENFVAFAPGFSDSEKQKYLKTVKDSSAIDRSYLSLLPQPFTTGLATRAQALFGGTVYLNEKSTTANFKTNAGAHKIIHIGTHAEANDLRPEYSRLIFAKEQQESEEENSVFLHQIYNCDLSSDLTVLAACESGKAGFQNGEGMVSLAHAFNYAGSESILTGLWKIDEQSSSMLMEQFYEQLAGGVSRDEALRQAKLHYLKSARGRMLAPQYWAGLVLMGDHSPMNIQMKHNTWIWIVSGIAIALLVLIAAVYIPVLSQRVSDKA